MLCGDVVMRPKQGRTPVGQQQPRGPGRLPRPARGPRGGGQSRPDKGTRGPGSLHTPFDPSCIASICSTEFPKNKSSRGIHFTEQNAPVLVTGTPGPRPPWEGGRPPHTLPSQDLSSGGRRIARSTATARQPPRPGARLTGTSLSASIPRDPRPPQKRCRVSEGSRTRFIRSHAPHSGPGPVTEINRNSLERSLFSAATQLRRRKRCGHSRGVPGSPPAASPAERAFFSAATQWCDQLPHPPRRGLIPIRVPKKPSLPSGRGTF